MHHLRKLGVPAQIVALLLVVFSGLDFIQAVWPVQLGDIKWRVLSMAYFSQVIDVPILGLLLAYTAALILEQPRMLRDLAITNGVMFSFLALSVMFYAVDALQMRAQVRDVTVKDYDLGITISFVRYTFALTILAVLAVSQRRAGKEIAAEKRIAGVGSIPLAFKHPESRADPMDEV